MILYYYFLFKLKSMLLSFRLKHLYFKVQFNYSKLLKSLYIPKIKKVMKNKNKII